MPDALCPPCRFEPGKGASESLVEAGGARVARDHAEPHARVSATLNGGGGGAQKEGPDAAALKLPKHMQGLEQRLRRPRGKGEREAGDLPRGVLCDEEDGVRLRRRFAKGRKLTRRVEVPLKDRRIDQGAVRSRPAPDLDASDRVKVRRGGFAD